MILHAEGMDVTEDSIKALLKESGVVCESYWPSLFVKALGKEDLDKLMVTPATGGGGGGAAGPAAAGGAEGGAVAEAAKEESEEEEDMAPVANMFGGDDDDY